jgi:hypothetical protein
MAAKTYDIDQDELAKYGLRYTGHSFRVGAVVLMHANRAKEDEIELCLRWTSACYSLYLRQMPKDDQSQITCGCSITPTLTIGIRPT